MTPTPIHAKSLSPFNEAADQLLEDVSHESQEFRIVTAGRRACPRIQESHALFALAERLDEEESLWLEARKASDATGSFVLTAGGTLQHSSAGQRKRPGDRFEDLRLALSLSFPGSSVIASGEILAAEGQLTTAIPLRGVPVHLSDLSGTADPDLLAVTPRETSDPKHVLLGACASENAFSDALRLLRQTHHPLALRLRFRPRRLSSHEIRQLSDLYRDLVGIRGAQLLTSAEVMRASDTAALVASWLTAKSGVELSVTVRSDHPPGEVLMSALSAVFSLPPSARRDSVEAALDLSGCFVSGQKRPDLTLDEDLWRYVAAAPSDAPGQVAAPSGAPIGATSHGARVRLDDKARSRHVLVCGSTGTGKSTLLKTMIASDVRSGHAVILIDPHGDLYDDVLAVLNRDPDIPVWLADTADLDRPYSLNLFQSVGDSHRQNFVCNQLIRLMKRSLYKDAPEGFGPMFEAYFRNAFLLLSDGGRGGYTISDMDRVFGDVRFRRELLEQCSDDHVRRFWRNIATRAGGEASLENIAPYIVSKLTQFVGNPVISPIVCSLHSKIDFSEVLDSGGACLVNLAKGQVGTTEAEILGGIFTTALFSAALARSSRSRAERPTVRVYLDEFQSYAGEVISEMLAECRKYGLEMTLATQSLSRLKVMNGDLTQSVLGNTGNIIAMRSGPQDATLLADWIGGGVTREDISSLHDFHALGRFLDNGRATPPLAFRLEESAEKEPYAPRLDTPF